MHSTYLNQLKRDRLFGKEITNVVDHKLQKKDFRLNHHSKKNPLSHRGISEDLTKRNASQVSKSSRNLAEYSIKPNITLHQKNPKKTIELVLHETSNNPQDVPQYFQECFDFMLKQEKHEPSLVNYMNGKQLNQSMRIILLDWLIDIHLKFKMFPSTLFIAVSLVDRYLSGNEVTRSKLQLVGATCLYMAAKYQQTYEVPELSEIIKVCAKVYNRQQFLEMEASILKYLDFDMIVDSSYKFLEPLCRIGSLQKKYCYLTRYILELSLFQLKSYKYKPSVLASASIYLTNKLKKKPSAWSSQLQKQTGYKQQELKPCAKDLLLILQKAAENQMLKNIKKKFSSVNYCEVSKLKFQKKQVQPRKCL